MDDFSVEVRESFHPDGSDPNDYYDSNFRLIYREINTALEDAFNDDWKLEIAINEI